MFGSAGNRVSSGDDRHTTYRHYLYWYHVRPADVPMMTTTIFLADRISEVDDSVPLVTGDDLVL
jgi:hypothetical protein